MTRIFEQVLADSNSVLRDILHQDALTLLRTGSNVTWFGQLMGRPQLIAWLLQLNYWFGEYNVKIV